MAPSNQGANINSSSQSFGMYGHDNTGATAARSFTGGALSIGQTFSFDLAVNYRNGYKGVNIYSGSTNVFQFIVGGDAYTVNNATMTNGSFGAYDQNTAVHISFTQISASSGSWKIDRTGGVTSTTTGTYAGDLTNFAFFVNLTSATDGYPAADNYYFNNLAVAVPEPATWLGGLMLLGVLGTQWKRIRVGGRLSITHRAARDDGTLFPTYSQPWI